ncbi:MAG: DUF302 domain-containing protein [Ignavibacteriae bacterium]|nr:MAG: DUF302 domain-containing protein [Ignavibacteriota bacterium]
MKYGLSKTTDLSFEQAMDKVTEELKKEGFGVLTSIDVKETLKNKLHVDFPRYTILGACNPPFAYQGLQSEEELGLLLPCNIIVFEKGGKVTVSIFDPMVITKIVEKNEFVGIAQEMKTRLERVIAAV